MTTATHTPGPWQAFGFGSDLRGSNGDPIALIHVLGGPCRETGEANARLIVEAPALLETLRKAQDLLRDLEAPAHLEDGEALDEEISALLARIDGEA